MKTATDRVHVLMRNCSHEGVVGSSCRGVVGFSLRCMRVTLVEFFSKGIACTHVELPRGVSNKVRTQFANWHIAGHF